MAEINLIPEQYRYWLWQQRALKQCALYLGVFAVLCLVLAFFLDTKTEQRNSQLEALRSENVFSQQEQKQYENVNGQLTELERQWQVLNGLRGGAAMQNLFVVIDRVLVDDQVWFNKWGFNRAGYAVSSASSNEDRSGAYYISMKDVNDTSTANNAWAIESQLEIDGSAKHHVAFSSFVERLLTQPEISNVKVVSTAMSPGENTEQYISFKIAILVNNSHASDQ